jgi:hypothetical protein
MSRGQGNVQRAIMGCLSQKWPSMSTLNIAHFIFYDEIAEGDAPTLSMLASTRRALSSLQTAGLVIRLSLVDDAGRSKIEWATVARRSQEQNKEEANARAGAKSRERSHQRNDARLRAKRRSSSSGLTLLSKILGMMGSSHDGEVLAAAKRAESYRAQLGISWEQIICGNDSENC